jgi:hypothetical protein
MRMNRGIARQGFALITAVVISAALLATIVGIATLTVQETRSQAQQGVSGEALAIAERGLSDAVTQLRAGGTLATKVTALADTATAQLAPSSGTGGTVSSTGHSFYWVMIQAHNAPTATNRYYSIYAAGFIVGPVISSYTSAQLKTLATSTTDVLARRVVQVTGTIGSTTVPGQGGGSTAFDYGVFTGTNLTISGSGAVTNGTPPTSGVFSANNITVSGSGAVTDVQLYAQATISHTGSGAVTPADLHPSYTSATMPTFPTLNLSAYMNLFDEFVAGTAPFDGSVANYPDLSNLTVRSAVLTALGPPTTVTVSGKSHYFVTPTNLSTYISAVVSGNGALAGLTSAQKTALKSTLCNSVFYVRDSATSANATWGGSNAINLAGVIVCSGDATFSGSGAIGLAIANEPFAILDVGVIRISGSGAVNGGIFYDEGADPVTGLGFISGSGAFQGQLICQNNVQVTGSGADTLINYVNYASASSAFGNLLPGGSATSTTSSGFTQQASGWAEKAWTDFLALPTPAS